MRILFATIFLISSSSAALAAPLQYRISQFGLKDAEHTADDGSRSNGVYRFNDSGYAAGSARVRSSSGGIGYGSTAWVYDGNTVRKTGLRNSSGDYIGTSFYGLGTGGHVIGYGNRTEPGRGRLTWVDDGNDNNNAVQIGLFDADHTRNDGAQDNFAYRVNASGQATGIAYRFKADDRQHTEQATYVGQNGRSAWFYDGNTTHRLGLTDTNHTQGVYGCGGQYGCGDLFGLDRQDSIAMHLTDAGKVVGWSQSFWDKGVPAPDEADSYWAWENGVTTRLGLLDTEHTRSTDGKQDSNYADNSLTLSFVNGAAQMTGVQQRYANNGREKGNSAWVYDGVTTKKIGLLSSVYRRASDDYRDNRVHGINESSQVIGTAARYGAASESLGQQAWVYNGSVNRVIGLKGAEHIDAVGGRYSSPDAINNAGQTAGYTKRYDVAGNEIGQSAWFDNGTASEKIGLIDAPHTRSTDGYKSSAVELLNETGQVAGTAERFAGDGTATGQSVWLFNGVTTVQVGLEGGQFVSNQGEAFNYVTMLNDAGFAAGYTDRPHPLDGVYSTSDFPYGGCPGEFWEDYLTGQCHGDLGRSAWVFDGADTIALDGMSSRSDGYSYSEVTYLGEDGLVIGSYEAFDSADNLLGDYAFAYRADFGLVNFSTLINSSFQEQDWTSIEDLFINDSGAIVGNGYLADGSRMSFNLTAVPIPGAVWLFASALAGLGWTRRSQSASTSEVIA